MTSRYEIQVNAVPRSYRDILAVAVSAAGRLKMRHIADEVRLVDMEEKLWASIRHDVSAPLWQVITWLPTARPL